MKRLFSTIFIFLMALIATIHTMASEATVDQLLEELANDRSVTMVYISPALIKSMNQADLNDYNLTRISKNATSIRIYVCKGSSSRNVADNYIKERQKMKPATELLTKIKNMNSDLEIYGVPKAGGKNNLFSSVIFMSKNPINSRLMIFEGEFDADDIASLSTHSTTQSSTQSTDQSTDQSSTLIVGDKSRPGVYPVYKRDYGPNEPRIEKIQDVSSGNIDIVFSDPSGILENRAVVTLWYGDHLVKKEAISKKLENGHAVYTFRVPKKGLSHEKYVIFFLDNRKYTRTLIW